MQKELNIDLINRDADNRDKETQKVAVNYKYAVLIGECIVADNDINWRVKYMCVKYVFKRMLYQRSNQRTCIPSPLRHPISLVN